MIWLLAAVGGAGILVVHYQTSVVATGYRISGLLETREALKEKNRKLRIELGRASVPDSVRASWNVFQERKETGKQTAPGGDVPGREEGIRGED